MAYKWGLDNERRVNVQEVVGRIRLKVSDSLVNKYSDTEIIGAINEGVELLWQSLSRHFSSLTHKLKEYDLVKGSALLPADFTAVEEICGNAMISGEHILGTGPVRLVYAYTPRYVTLLEDIVDVPITLIPDVVAIASNVVTNNASAARARADIAAERVSQRREYGPIPAIVGWP
jgi:hypothetical protein